MMHLYKLEICRIAHVKNILLTTMHIMINYKSYSTIWQRVGCYVRDQFDEAYLQIRILSHCNHARQKLEAQVVQIPGSYFFRV